MVKKSEKEKRVIPQRVPGQRPASSGVERPSQKLFAEVLKQMKTEEDYVGQVDPVSDVSINLDQTQPRPDPDQTQTAQTPPRPNPDRTQARPRPLKKSIIGSPGKAPVNDYNKRANSIERDALPAGLFPAGSKAVYDALYLRTIGAVTARRVIQATRGELMAWTGIKNIKTINAHVKRLKESGLINVTMFAGEQGGSHYEVFIPEEVGIPNPDQTQTSTTQPRPDPDQKLVPHPDQKLDPDQYQELVWVGSGNPPENKDTYEFPNTSLKPLKTYDDDEFAQMLEILKAGCIEVCGKQTSKNHGKNWADLAQVLILELKVAAERTGGVSNPPAFLAEVLRRRFLYSRKIEDGSKKTTKPDLVGKADPFVKDREVGEPLDGQKGREKALEDILGFVSFAGGKIKPGDLEEFETWYAPDDWIIIKSKLEEFDIW